MFGTFGSSLSQTSAYSRHNVSLSIISMELERVNSPRTVSGRLRSCAPHVRNVRKDDIILQRHLPYGFLKTQGTSTFAIVNPECPISPIRHDKETIIFVHAGFSTRRLLSDIISGLKCNLRQTL